MDVRTMYRSLFPVYCIIGRKNEGPGQEKVYKTRETSAYDPVEAKRSVVMEESTLEKMMKELSESL